MFISIVVVVVFAIIVIAFYPTKKNVIIKTTSTPAIVEKDAIEKRYNALDKKSLKMMSYKDALAASKQFIYDITRAIIQRFTPDSQKEVIKYGKELYDAGVEYVHVVDVFALSVEKTRTLSAKPVEKEQTISRQ